MRLSQKALTFDDVLLVPAFSAILPRDTDLTTRLTRSITLNIPLVSAAMDTVTEARLAIAMAQEGGIGIVHKNMPPKQQARRGRARQALRIRRAARSDHDPAVDDGARGHRADAAARHLGLPGASKAARSVGIVTNRDLRFEDALDARGARDHDAAREARHGPRRRDARRGEGADAPPPARARASSSTTAFELRGLITVKDITEGDRASATPRSDEQGKLRVGAALGVGDGTDERAELLAARRRRRLRRRHRARPQRRA